MFRMRYHLPHPTQHAACGTNTSALVLQREVFLAKPDGEQCKRCLNIQKAIAAGRPVYSGIEPAAFEGVDPEEIKVEENSAAQRKIRQQKA